MKLSSPVFKDNEQIPSHYTCDAENVNPPLIISDVPENAKSLVLLVEDPDAVSKVPWIHWVLYNMPPHTTEIEENKVPQNTLEGITDFGNAGWGGPCPPSGNHRYFFKLYALDILLDLKGTPTRDIIIDAMKGHILTEAELIGLYQRQK